jgi:hypothetical protein
MIFRPRRAPRPFSGLGFVEGLTGIDKGNNLIEYSFAKLLINESLTGTNLADIESNSNGEFNHYGIDPNIEALVIALDINDSDNIDYEPVSRIIKVKHY